MIAFSAAKSLSPKIAIAGLAMLVSAFAGSPAIAETKTAMVAGGCFWCVEKDFEHVKGVYEVQSGYAGGKTKNPTYKTYEKGGHIEVAKIFYDSTKISYAQILEIFWRTVDPTDAGGQFCDRGHAYTTAIFFANDEERRIAQHSKSALEASGILKKPIVTPVLPSAKFWPSETYHQDYYKKNSAKYKYYRWRCGRDQTVKKLWGKQAYRGVNGS